MLQLQAWPHILLVFDKWNDSVISQQEGSPPSCLTWKGFISQCNQHLDWWRNTLSRGIHLWDHAGEWAVQHFINVIIFRLTETSQRGALLVHLIGYCQPPPPDGSSFAGDIHHFDWMKWTILYFGMYRRGEKGTVCVSYFRNHPVKILKDRVSNMWPVGWI